MTCQSTGKSFRSLIWGDRGFGHIGHGTEMMCIPLLFIISNTNRNLLSILALTGLRLRSLHLCSSAMHVCLCVYVYNSSDDDVCYLSQHVGAVPMEGVDFSIEGVDVSSSLHRAGSWTVLLCTPPLTTLTHTASTQFHLSCQWISDEFTCNHLQNCLIYKLEYTRLNIFWDLRYLCTGDTLTNQKLIP